MKKNEKIKVLLAGLLSDIERLETELKTIRKAVAKLQELLQHGAPSPDEKFARDSAVDVFMSHLQCANPADGSPEALMIAASTEAALDPVVSATTELVVPLDGSEF